MNRFQSFKLALSPDARFTARPTDETPEQKRTRETRETVADMRRKLQEDQDR
jgi:hypothetical protein